MRQSARIFLNTGVAYLRMLITVPIGILVTRYVYGALGEVDYGLFATLAASGVILGILNTALVESAQRNLAFAIGEGGADRSAEVFRSVLALFSMAGPVVALVGALLAPALLHALKIPPDRAETSWWVLHLTILTIAVNTAATPYRSLLNAHQQMPLLALIEVLNQVVNLGIALALLAAPGDRLLLYSCLLLGLGVWSAVWTAGAALRRFPESRVAPLGAKWQDVKQVGGFAGWVVASQLANHFRNRGALLIAGAVFNPAVAAGYGLALRAHDYMYRLAQGISIAVKPVVAQSAGKGREELVARLAISTNKYSFLVVSCLWGPLVLECETLLRLWLSKPAPDGAVVFTQLFCTMAAIGVASWGNAQALQAKNLVRPVSLISMGTTGVSLVVSWLGCQFLAWPAWSIPAMMVVATAFLSLIVTPLLACRALGWTYSRWMLQGPLLAFSVSLAALAAAVLPHALLVEGGGRLLAVTGVYGIVVVVLGWLFAVSPDERELAMQMAERLRSRSKKVQN